MLLITKFILYAIIIGRQNKLNKIKTKKNGINLISKYSLESPKVYAL